MNQPVSMLRLSPQVAGELQQQCTKATTEPQELTRFRKEFDRQLAALIGNDNLRKLHKDTKNALLLADLVKEAA
jgi:nicotinic acid mononucleotide adenylyltransferase